jgi:hypothetical protein
MAKMLDLNALDQPVLELKLRDAERTVFKLTTPTTKLVEKFTAAKNEIAELKDSRDPAKIKALYELTAELISCNADYITVTAEEIRDKYRLTFGDLVVIFAAYLDFIKDFNNAKN